MYQYVDYFIYKIVYKSECDPQVRLTAPPNVLDALAKRYHEQHGHFGTSKMPSCEKVTFLFPQNATQVQHTPHTLGLHVQ